MDWLIYALLGCLTLFVILVGAWVWFLFIAIREERED